MNIVIIGAGNIGTQFACMCAYKGHRVTIYTKRASEFDKVIEIVDENNEIISGNIYKITDELSEAMEDCNMVIVTKPAFMFEEVCEQLKPYIDRTIDIGFMPGEGGVEFIFSEFIEKGNVIFGLQRVPTVARLEKYGKRVRCEGKRSRLDICAIPHSETKRLAEFMSDLFDMPCDILPNYLNVTLTPSNPILHTTRLKTMFKDYYQGIVYKNNPLFYGDWNEEASDLLIKCDEELQEMCKILSEINLTEVKSLKLHYEGNTSKEITEKLRSIKSLHNITSPMVKQEDGYVPDLKSRYFMADFPYGLAIIEGLAKILKYNAENIFETMDWYRKLVGKDIRFELGNYGIESKKDLYNFYLNKR